MYKCARMYLAEVGFSPSTMRDTGVKIRSQVLMARLYLQNPLTSCHSASLQSMSGYTFIEYQSLITAGGMSKTQSQSLSLGILESQRNSFKQAEKWIHHQRRDETPVRYNGSLFGHRLSLLYLTMKTMQTVCYSSSHIKHREGGECAFSQHPQNSTLLETADEDRSAIVPVIC